MHYPELDAGFWESLRSLTTDTQAPGSEPETRTLIAQPIPDIALCHLARQGENASLSHSALVQQFATIHPDADFDRALELLLRRDVIETIISPETNEPSYHFQVELIRHWFLRDRT